MEFVHGVDDEGLGDHLEISRGGIEQASGGNVVDLSWDSSSIIMDEGFGVGLE